MKIRSAAAVLVFILTAAAAGGAERSFLIGVFAGAQRFPAYGSAAEYVRGENDFPVTPAHAAAMAGFSFGRVSGPFLFELEARWTLPRAVVLNDPSDGDSVSVSTAAHVSMVLNALVSPLHGTWRPFVEAGGGVEAVLVRSETVTTAYGYMIDRPALRTADRFDPEAHLGGGLIVSLGEALALRFGVRAVWIFDDPHPVRSLQAAGGLALRF
jgi:hypothetical protein